MAYVSNFLTQSSTTGAASYVLTLPPHVADDVIVVCVSADGGGTLAASGWTQVGSTQVSGLLLSGAVFYKKAAGSSETCTITMGTADAIHVHMVILKDVDTSTQLDASNATVATTALEFTTASITTNTADCLILYYVAGDDATTTPHAMHSRPGPTATMHFLDSSDNGGTTVTTLASGAIGWYIQRAATSTPQPQWDQSSTEVYASFVMAWRNKSGGLIPPYVDDSGSLGQQLMTGTWWASATTRNNQNFKATPLTFPTAGPQFVTTATSGTGTIATISFATQPAPPFAVGSSITVAGGITPTGYAQAAATVTACTTSSVSYANVTTGAQTVPGTVGGSGTAFDAGAAVVDAGLNPYSSAITSTPVATTTILRGFELNFPTAEYDMTTGWIVGAFQTSTSKMALFNQGSIAQGGGYIVVGKTFNAIATTATSGTGTVATITFAAQSIAIPVGTVVTVAGVTPTGYNGSYTVTASSTTTVSYANTTSGAQSVAGTVTANQYRTFNIMARDNQDGAGAGFAVFSVKPNQTQTNFGYSGGNVLPITKINSLLVLNNGNNATGAFYYMDFHLIKKIIVAGGDATTPIDTQGLYDIGRFNRIPLLKKSGASGLVVYVPLQIGGGDAVNFQIDAGALQFPRISSAARKEINYHGDNNAVGISYAGKSGDVIKHTNSVVTSPSSYYWEINSAATSAAIWDFTGLVIVGANVTLRNVMTFDSMAFSSCLTLNFSSCTVTGATISRVPAGNDTLTTDSTTVISGSTINVTGVTAGNRWCSVASPVIFANNTFTGSSTTGHAMRITLTTGSPFALVGNTFTSFGPTVFGFHTTNGVTGDTSDWVTKADHGYTTGDPIRYMKQGGSVNMGLTDDTTYYVRALTSSTIAFYTSAANAIADTGRIDLTSNGAETHYINSLGAAIFNDSVGAITLNVSGGVASPTVRNGANASTTITNNVNVTITIKDSAGTAIPGVEVAIFQDNAARTQVLASTATDGSGQVATTAAASLGAIIIRARQSTNITSFATSQAFTSEILSTGSTNHNFRDGDAVVYSKNGGSAVIGLTAGATYYVNNITATTLSLHTSAANAISDTSRVDLTTNGTETHLLDPVRYVAGSATGTIGTTAFSTTITMITDNTATG